MRMKKNCNYCRASYIDRRNAYCDLGYKVEAREVNNLMVYEGVPQEPCPKPKTYSAWLKLKQSTR
jgi:hypothetical protein